jgi:hypothetical protein
MAIAEKLVSGWSQKEMALVFGESTSLIAASRLGRLDEAVGHGLGPEEAPAGGGVRLDVRRLLEYVRSPFWR